MVVWWAPKWGPLSIMGTGTMGESGEEMNTLATILKSTILFLFVLGLLWVAGMEISTMVGHPIGHPL
jgi:hypothetical protein